MAAAGRGERLYPRRSSRLYAVLTRLRSCIESVIAEDLPVGSSLTLVDYGCGNMPYRPLFEARGVRYLGADLPGNEMAEQVIDGEGRVNLPAGSCDLVLSTQVLEHVVSPEAYLAESRRLLRPGGKLVLSTHGYWPYHPDPTDFWRWTGDGLRRAIGLGGFEVERTRGILGLSAASAQLLQDALLRRFRWLPRRMFPWAMQRAIGLLDRLHSADERMNDAAVFVITARRTDDR